MTDNFTSWHIDCNEVDAHASVKEKLAFLLRYAVLAPSSHNSQPWSFTVTSDGIAVSPDTTRALVVSDSNQRQLYISIGCAVENIIIAGRRFGLTFTVKEMVDDDLSILLSVSNVREIKKQRKRGLVEYITQRSTIRGNYSQKEPDQNFVSWVREYTQQQHVQPSFVTGKEQKEAIAEVVIDATLEAMDDPMFRAELSDYLLPPNTSAQVGMPAVGFGIPRLLAYIAPAVLKYANVNKTSQAKDRALLTQHTPMFIVLASEGDTKTDWVRVGRVYQHLALMATKKNIHTAPMAAPIQIGNHYKDLQKILKTNLRPQFFMRIGSSQEQRVLSPRLSAEECTTS